MRVTFLGTGIMGAPMARHLAQAGHTVTAWNRSAEKAQVLAAHGVAIAQDPAAAAVDAEVIVTMLTDAEAVEDVMAEAASAAPDATLWWQASTVGLSGTEGLVALAEEHALTLVDAPVLGSKGPAEQGALAVLASGPETALRRLAPLFAAVGTKTITVGETGAGTRLKLVLNHWVLTVTDAIAETITFAEGLDLDPALFLDAIAGGPLDIAYAHLKGPGMIAGELPVNFPLRHALKDAELILEAGERHDLALALAATVRDRFAQAAAAGYADADMGMVVQAGRPPTSAR
jgi:3-hydroxyisobutyrate dehydrogenase